MASRRPGAKRELDLAAGRTHGPPFPVLHGLMNTLQRLKLGTIGPILGLLVLAFLSFWNQELLSHAQANRYESYRLANELRQSSDELTRMARTYVLTGDPAYEQKYWEILAVRNGEKPRPDGRTVALRTLMEEQGFTSAELSKLQEAEDNSNALVTTETIAMNAVKGRFADGRGGYTKEGEADFELARRIMHDEKYHADKAIIMNPIADFERMIDDRTEREVAVADWWTDLLALLVVGLAAVATVMTWLAMARHGRELRRAVGQLASTAENVSSGATQVAAASQSLAQGASEQVAAVEDIAASARETSAMAGENARRTHSAAEMVGLERDHFSNASARLTEMVQAMEAIDEAGSRISRINKVIDEIAFQTNILALNAAVEAARAGDAGLGFAVVADEVRSLAQRSAQAARETATLIEESIARAGFGREKVAEVSSAITLLAEQSTKLRSLIDEVQAGNREQLKAVERIGSSLEQIEHVSQSAAAGAEQGSASSEQLSAQAAGLLDVVSAIQSMVGR